jgi:Uncharacterized protein conserved in bacteria (DUF2188)
MSYKNVLDQRVVFMFDIPNEKVASERFMPRKGPETHHVLPNPDGGWNVRRGGSDRASSHHDTKREAIDAGREVSRNQGTEFRIHNRDGRIASSDSHGGDPNPPKG